MANAFEVADSVLNQGVRNIAELIKCPGLVNVDFADIKSVMTNAGRAHMGVGIATGKNKAEEAARLAVSSPLLETTIEGAKGVVISMRACPDIELDEVENAAKIISDAADSNANIIWGVQLDSALEDQIEITVIATGFGTPIANQEPQDISSGAKRSLSARRIHRLISVRMWIMEKATARMKMISAPSPSCLADNSGRVSTGTVHSPGDIL